MITKKVGSSFTAIIGFNHTGPACTVIVGFSVRKPGLSDLWGSSIYGAYRTISVSSDTAPRTYSVTVPGNIIATTESESDVDLYAFVNVNNSAVLEHTERAHIAPADAQIPNGDGQPQIPSDTYALPTNDVVNVVVFQPSNVTIPKGMDAARYATTVDMYKMQAWLATELGGPTFQLGAVVGFKSPRTLAYLQGGSDCTDINYCGEGFCQSRVWSELGSVGIQKNVKGQVLGVVVAGGGAMNFGSPWSGAESGAFFLTWWRLYWQLKGSGAPCCVGGNLGHHDCETEDGWMGSVMQESVLAAIAGESFAGVHVGDHLTGSQKSALLASRFIKGGVNIYAALAPPEYCINLTAIEPYDHLFPAGVKEAAYVGALLLNETRLWIANQLGGPTFRLGTINYMTAPYSLATLQDSPPVKLPNYPNMWEPNECGEGYNWDKVWQKILGPMMVQGQINIVVLSGGGGMGHGGGNGTPDGFGGPNDSWHPNSGISVVGDWAIAGALAQNCSTCIRTSGALVCQCNAADCWIRYIQAHELMHCLGVDADHHSVDHPGLFPGLPGMALTTSERQVLLASPYIRNW